MSLQVQSPNKEPKKAASSGDAPQSALQNPKVQIAVIAVGAIALIVVVWLVFFPDGFGGGSPSGPRGSGTTTSTPASTSTSTPAAGNATSPTPAPGVTPAAGTGTGPSASGGGTRYTAPEEGPGAGTPPATAGGGAGPAPATPGGTERRPAAPSGLGRNARNNPFEPNSELRRVIGSIRPLPPPARPQAPYAPATAVYQELYTPKAEEVVTDSEYEGPPVPPMRVAGVIHGDRVETSALLQIGSQVMRVLPGKMIPQDNPIYRVERIEGDRVILSRRWQIGNRRGVQRIEVTLSGAAPQGAGDPGAGAGPTF